MNMKPITPSPPKTSRRQLLAGVMLAPIAATLRSMMASAQSPRRTFVLVHGAWHGAWCWTKLTPLLTSAGHRVHAPTLTGLGERSHLLTPEVDLDTHIKDVSALFHYEDIHDAILVGHSYGGMVVAGVAPSIVSRLAGVIYLDAFLPDDGKALKDYVPLRVPEGVWRLPAPGGLPRFGVSDPADVAWMEARLGDQPVRTFTQAVRIESDISRRVPHTYILCTKADHFVAAAERAKQRGFKYRELLSAGHDAMITQPGELARLLTE
jgi:pimeloyl-ACP methyl ester carboxylesterase